jgi:hypothetical protein
MSDTVNFAEFDGQHVELLPARTVLSMVSPQLHVGDATSTSSSHGNSNGNPVMSMFNALGGGQSHGADGANDDGSNAS